MGKAYLESPKSIGIWQDEQEGEEQGECERGGRAWRIDVGRASFER
jgi:hypothetical protein